MARVIQDMPDDPIGYIINVLQGIHKKQSKKLDNSFVSLTKLLWELFKSFATVWHRWF